MSGVVLGRILGYKMILVLFVVVPTPCRYLIYYSRTARSLAPQSSNPAKYKPLPGAVMQRTLLIFLLQSSIPLRVRHYSVLQIAPVLVCPANSFTSALLQLKLELKSIALLLHCTTKYCSSTTYCVLQKPAYYNELLQYY